MADFDDIDTDVPRAPAEAAALSALISIDGSVVMKALPERGDVTIGRESSCDLVLHHASVSRQHATLSMSPLAITDAGSKNGTRVRGVTIDAGVATQLSVGDAVQIGHVVVLIHSSQILDGVVLAEQASESSANRLETECARSARSGSPFAFLRIEIDDGESEEVSEVLRQILRASDVVSAEGANMFWALLVDTTAQQAELGVERMLQLLQRRGIMAKVGIARYPHDGVSSEQLSGYAWEQLARAPGTPPTDMDHVRELIAQIAPSEVSVLITGETGVGKELCAEMIHRLSPRATKPFVKLNCAAVVESLIESELFGHERGAFTGAHTTRAGLLEAGNGGTVFLDEIGEMPLNVQSKLLRVLEERQVRPVGSMTSKKLDVRFIFASNRVLPEEVEAGRFREDLYYRINGITLDIPPLRDRRSEIAPLARAFAARSRASGSLVISPDVIARLEQHRWPGNIRELRNTVERAVLLSSGGVLRPSHLALDGGRGDISTRPMPRVTQTDLEPPATKDTVPLADAVAEVERRRILKALEDCGGNQTRAARMLGISRNTLLSRLDAYGIPRPRKS